MNKEPQGPDRFQKQLLESVRNSTPESAGRNLIHAIDEFVRACNAEHTARELRELHRRTSLALVVLAAHYLISESRILLPSAGYRTRQSYLKEYLVSEAEHLKELASRYSEGKSESLSDKTLSFATVLPDIYKVMSVIVDAEDQCLADVVSSTLTLTERDSSAEGGREFWSPTTEPSLQRFALVQANSRQCIFAMEARIWSAQSWRSRFLSIEDYLKDVVSQLRHFSQCAIPEKLDGFLIEIGPPFSANSIEDLAQKLATILKYVASHDHSAARCLSQSICDAEWHFVFNDLPLFVTVFASFYPLEHPRFCPAAGFTYFLLQPIASLDWHGVSSRGKDAIKIRKQIQERFSSAGKPYKPPSGDLAQDAVRFIEPISGSNAVKWWEYLD